MAGFTASPGVLAASASAWAGIGHGLTAAGVAAAAALEGMAAVAGDPGLSGALEAAGASAAASLGDVGAQASAFGPALTATARNYERSDDASTTGLRRAR